jgi:hypothetical protein
MFQFLLFMCWLNTKYPGAAHPVLPQSSESFAAGKASHTGLKLLPVFDSNGERNVDHFMQENLLN